MQTVSPLRDARINVTILTNRWGCREKGRWAGGQARGSVAPVREGSYSFSAASRIIS